MTTKNETPDDPWWLERNKIYERAWANQQQDAYEEETLRQTVRDAERYVKRFREQNKR